MQCEWNVIQCNVMACNACIWEAGCLWDPGEGQAVLGKEVRHPEAYCALVGPLVAVAYAGSTAQGSAVSGKGERWERRVVGAGDICLDCLGEGGGCSHVYFVSLPICVEGLYRSSFQGCPERRRSIKR